MTTEVAVKVSRLDQIMEALSNEYAGKYEIAAKLKGLELVKALRNINKEIEGLARKMLNDEQEIAAKAYEKQSKSIDAFKTLAADVFTEVWNIKLVKSFAPLTFAKNIVIRVDRTENGAPGKPTVLLGVPSAKGSKGGSRGPRQPMVVDGTTYESGSAAKKALMPTRANAQMSRLAVAHALIREGHKVG